MSLNDALSLDLNLSADDLRNVAAQLISQQNLSATNRIIQNLSCDSDGFSSECSDISTTTTSGSSIQSYIISSFSNEVASNIFTVENQIQNIFNRPKIVSVSNLVVDKLNDTNAFKVGKGNLPNKTLEKVESNQNPKIGALNQEEDKNLKTTKVTVFNKALLEITKQKKGRGGWPKGRKRKPELLNLPPKAPATGYNLYLNEQRKSFKDSSLAFHEITKIIGNKWSSLTLAEKKPYLEKAEEDKKRYREELRQYRQSDAYRAYLTKKRKKRLQNNVLSESDMDATDDFDVSYILYGIGWVKYYFSI